MAFLENSFDFSDVSDLNMYCCGKRIKTYNHSYGPAVKERFLLTFVTEGEGELYVKDKMLKLVPGDLLIVYPGEMLYYKVKDGMPWTIRWIGVYGNLVESFLGMLSVSRENPVYHVPDTDAVTKIMDRLFDESSENTPGSKFTCIGLLYDFFAALTKNTVFGASKRDYVREAIKYIDFCYDMKLSLSEVAKMVNLEKSYLAKIFKRETGVTVTGWICDLRIKKACQLLMNTDLTVRQIALSVGIENQLYFSKLFKKIMKVSPTEYRENRE